jgi:hypothetical protein
MTSRPGLACLLAIAACSPLPDAAPAPWPVQVQLDFTAAADAAAFAFSDAAQWRWHDDGNRPALELLGKSDYAPPFRSPHSLAILQGLAFGDFDLEVDLLQTSREYGHRDLCLVFGFQSPSRFGYVHLATTPDPHAHNVFVVDEAPRRAVAPTPVRGVDWGQGVWRHVRVERRLADDAVRVYWDHAPEPILVATATGLDWGQIGLGSFDDAGRFANLTVRAPAVRHVASGSSFATR